MTEHSPAPISHAPRRVFFGPDTAWAETYRQGDQDITRYQVLGERSSGTNYLDTLLAGNLAIKPRAQFQWKHGYPITHIVPRTQLTIVSFRDPLDWLRSMHKKPWHAPQDVWQMPLMTGSSATTCANCAVSKARCATPPRGSGTISFASATMCIADGLRPLTR